MSLIWIFNSFPDLRELNFSNQASENYTYFKFLAVLREKNLILLADNFTWQDTITQIWIKNY